MADDYRVEPYDNIEIHEFAKKVRRYFGFSHVSRIDVVECVRHRSIWTVTGEKKLLFEVLPDSEMAKDDGATSYGKDAEGRSFIKISIKHSVYRRASMGLGRDRMTLAHEIGHAVMHDGVRMARRATGNVSYLWLSPYESAEHQAKVFAAALMINDSFAAALNSPEEISVGFGISIEAATIYFAGRKARVERANVAQKMRKFADEFGQSVSPSRAGPKYLNSICMVCNNRTLFEVGHKIMCRTCDTLYDRLQDGDPSFG